MSFLKGFMTAGVSGIGLNSLRLLVFTFFGRGLMAADSRYGGTLECSSEKLNIYVKTAESCLAQALSTLPGTLSCPLAFLGFTDLKTRLTWCPWRVRGGWCSVSMWRWSSLKRVKKV